MMEQDNMTLPDGQIDPDSEAGKLIGFTSDKFEGWLWKSGDRVMISMIISLQPNKGNLSALFKAIEAQGLRVAVPTPFVHLEAIIKSKGFKPHIEDDAELGPCEVWER